MGVDLGDGTQRIRVSVQRCDPHTKTIGRKRISVLHAVGGDDHDNDDQQSISSRKQHKIIPTSSNRLELLPQEILIHLLCKVNRGTLKDLILVSKTVNEAALIAKESHFDVSTPISKPCYVDADDGEAPDAPKRVSRTSRFSSKLIGSIAVALFAGPAEED